MEDETTVVYNTRPPNQTNAPGEPEIVEPPPMLNRYVELFEKNDHMVGYISIDPYINYPVLQPQDDMPADYYLNHNFERRRTSNGTIFACKFNEFSPFGRPDNTIIHGHNLQTKNMFEPLLNYRHRNDATAFQFLKDNHIIRFDTLFEPGLYKIFSVFQTTINDRHGEFFPYQRQRSFPTEDDFFEYVTEVLDRSRYHTPVDLRYGDELLTLSTCDFSIGEADMRLVIVARRVRFDEIARMDTDKFINLRDNNTSRSRAGRTDDGHMRYKMFEGWYNRSNSGRGWAGREWDTSRVEGLCDWLQKTGFTGAGR
jgi:sortase B